MDDLEDETGACRWGRCNGGEFVPEHQLARAVEDEALREQCLSVFGPQ